MTAPAPLPSLPTTSTAARQDLSTIPEGKALSSSSFSPLSNERLPPLPKVEEITEIDARDKQTADDWVARHKGLIRLTGKHPFNAEPSPNTLVDQGFITPVPLHYVRNHGAVPKLTWEGHRVRVTGLGLPEGVAEKAFSMDQLLSMEIRKLPVTLVCAGNRRKEVNMVKQSKGFSWGPAAVSTSVWTGVPLHVVLKAAGVDMNRAGRNAYVCFDGPDLELHHGTYGTSIPLRKAMDPTHDVLIAFEQNGEKLKPDHGYPVRLIIPGYIGGRMIKWLTRITITSDESQSYYHYYDNRVLPSMVDNDRADKEDWWHKPDYIINDLNLNSAITHPAHNEEVVVGQKTYRVRGYAYCGGGHRVSRVELSFDDGKTWEVVQMSPEEYPTEHGRFWCWRLWELEVDTIRLVGGNSLLCRAWDDQQNTQPRDLTWNVMGMMNNSFYRIHTAPCRTAQSELAIRMTHPVLAGNTPGGWMVKPAVPGQVAPPVAPTAGESKSASVSTASTMNSPLPPPEPSLPRINPMELARHSTREDAWIAVKDLVYNVTPYLSEHPGGLASLVGAAGKDATEDFEGIHSPKAWTLLAKFVIGVLDPTAPMPTDIVTTDGVAPGLQEEEKAQPTSGVVVVSAASGTSKPSRLSCRLVSRTQVSKDVYVLRFALATPEHTLGMAVGHHVQVRTRIDGRLVLRSYTPISEPDQKGYFDLLIRVYRANEHPKFPQGGVMSQYLDSLPLGCNIDVDPPHGHLLYEGRGLLNHLGERMQVKHFACVAGGTGITPIWQVLRAVLADKKDETTISLIYAARSPSDLLLRKELTALSEQYPDSFRVWYTVDTVDGYEEAAWPYSMGFVNDALMGQHFPKASDDVAVLMCGPPPMLKFAVRPGLEKLGFRNDQCFSF